MRITHQHHIADVALGEPEARGRALVYVSDVDIVTHLGDGKGDVLAEGTMCATTTGLDGPLCRLRVLAPSICAFHCAHEPILILGVGRYRNCRATRSDRAIRFTTRACRCWP